MKIQIPVKELIDKGLWERACDIKGINPWAYNGGIISGSKGVEFSEDEALKLDLLPKDTPAESRGPAL